MKKLILFIFLFIFSFPVVAEEKKAGKTLLTRGSVIGKRDNGNIALKRRSPIYEKDEIHVGRGGRAQFRMIDQAIISLQENSVLKIKKYQFKQGAVSNSALLELLTGGLRTITGAIGKGNKKAYELRTPLATIGIRGTDYEVEIVSNGMYVATWEGVIHLRSRLNSGCNMLVGRSQPYMFVFIDRQGKCKGIQQVPDVFRAGHSSNISVPSTTVAKVTKSAVHESLLDAIPDNELFKHRGFIIDQTRPATRIISSSNTLSSSTPTFKVGLELYNLAEGGTVSNYEQSVGGYKVSWGYWNKFSNVAALNDINSQYSNMQGMIWSAYDASDIAVVASRSGVVRYDNVIDSLSTSSAGRVNNLQVQMDVNFESGDITKGALSASTPTDTWVAVFGGNIASGDMNLSLNGVNVIDSNSMTPSPVRDASGFIAGDFVGDKAQAILGGFGFSENNVQNHIEGVFLIGEGR